MPPTTPSSARRTSCRDGTLARCAVTAGNVPVGVTCRRLAIDEQSVPPLESEQRPNQKTVVHLALEVLVQDSANVLAPEPTSAKGARVEEDLLDITHRLAA